MGCTSTASSFPSNHLMTLSLGCFCTISSLHLWVPSARLRSSKICIHLCEIWRHLVVHRHWESTVAAENKLVFLKQMNVGTKQTSSGFWDNIYAVNKRSKFILTSNPWKSKIHESFCNAHLCPFTVNEGELNPSSIVRVKASGAWLLPLMPPVWGKFRNDSQPSCRSYI